MMGSRVLAIALALGTIAAASPAHAKKDSAAMALSPTDAVVVAAQERGNLLYAYDQAAWHSTDVFFAAMDPALQGLLRGYVIEPGDGDTLNVSFYGVRPSDYATYVAYARYAVRGSKVISGGMLARDADASLSPNALRMITAREVALKELQARKWGFCNRNSPNLLVLPNGTDGATSVYIMSSSVTAGLFPAGGHFRFDVAADGKLTSARPFMNSCIDMQSKDGKGNEAVMGFLTHVLDPHPTEIHVFISRTLGMPMMIATGKDQFWLVENGKIDSAPAVFVDTK